MTVMAGLIIMLVMIDDDYKFCVPVIVGFTPFILVALLFITLFSLLCFNYMPGCLCVLIFSFHVHICVYSVCICVYVCVCACACMCERVC